MLQNPDMEARAAFIALDKNITTTMWTALDYSDLTDPRINFLVVIGHVEHRLC